MYTLPLDDALLTIAVAEPVTASFPVLLVIVEVLNTFGAAIKSFRTL
jgi:hypothetical protein